MGFDINKVDFGSIGKGSGDSLLSPVEDLQIEALAQGATEEEASLNGKLPRITNVSIDHASQARPVLNEAMKVNPEQFSKTKRLSEQTGLPSSIIEADPEAVERTQKLNEIDFYEMSKKNPVTFEHLSQYENAAIAHDDIPTLQKIEDTLGGLKDAYVGQVKRNVQYVRDVKSSFDRGVVNVESSEIGTKQMMSVLFDSEPATPEEIARLNELERNTHVARDDLNFIEGIPMAGAEQLPILWEIGTGAAKGAAGGALITGLTPALAALFAGGPVAAGTTFLAAGAPGAKIGARVGVAAEAFSLEGGLAFNEFQKMDDGQGNRLDTTLAAQGAFGVGVANAGLEFISVMALGRTVTPAVRYAIRNRVKQALMTETGKEMFTRISVAYASAVATEGVTEGLQEFVTIMGGELVKILDDGSFKEMAPGDLVEKLFDPNMWDRILESFKKGTQASLLFSSFGTSVQVAQRHSNRLHLSKNEILQLDVINETAGEAKLKEKSVEDFRKFVEKADGDNNTHVFVDADLATLYLQEKTDEEINADPALKLLKEKLEESAPLDADIDIPVADFAADVTGTEHYDALRDGMTLNEDSVNTFRQEGVRKEFEAYINQMTEEAEENVSEYVEAQDIFNTVKAQLIDSGQYSSRHADIMARLVPARMTVFARQNGIPVQEAFERFGFTVEGPQTGEMARLSAEVLSQEDIAAFPESPVQVEGFDNTNAADFHAKMSEAVAVNKNAASVRLYDESEYENMRLYTVDNGRAGFALEYDGELISVFKHPDSTLEGAIDTIIPAAIEAGATKLEAFEGFLTEAYARHGFEEVDRVPWDDNFAPEGWDKETQGTPDVVLMDLKEELRNETTKPQQVRDSSGVRQSDNGGQQAGERTGRDQSGGYSPLEGAPIIEGATGPDQKIVSVASKYASDNGIDLNRQTTYVEIDEDFSEKLAEAYEQMEHAPDDPVVKEAFDNLIKQTTAQYDALVEAGYEFYFIDEANDPYEGNPWNAMRELRADQRMGVFPTEEGFGSGDTALDVSSNPLLADTGIKWGGKRVLANDLFRAVHDAFGHGMEGAGFRARGEENAWQAHARLFTGSALGAITTETRGQNSWLNYGPHGEANRTAQVEDTVFADQKTGLMPEWTWTENVAGDKPDVLKQPISSTQDFGDLTISEEVEIEGAQGTATVTQSAQKMFDDTMKRRNVVEQLIGCLGNA